MRLDSAITYSVSDYNIWQVLLLEQERGFDFSLDTTLVDTGNTIVTGRLEKLGSKEELTIETALGFNITGASYKAFVSRLEIELPEKRTVLTMLEHCTAQGESLPLQNRNFRILKTPSCLNDENWLYLYKLN
jgi:hypothetical protein